MKVALLAEVHTFLAVSGLLQKKMEILEEIKIISVISLDLPRISDPDVVGNLSYFPELVVLFVGIQQEVLLPRHLRVDLNPDV